MHWWILIPIAAAILIGLYGLFRWASMDPAIDAEMDKARFGAERDWREVRRSSTDAASTASGDRVQDIS